MRLVIEYSIGDGFTYSSVVSRPIVYESAESFLEDFESACLEAYNSNDKFCVGGLTFNTYDFFFDDEFFAPDVSTVDEWYSTVENG